MPQLPRSLLGSCGLALAAMLVGGLWFYHAEESRLREAAEGQLAAIVKLKAQALAEWRHTTLDAVAEVAEQPALMAALMRGLAQLPDAERAPLRAALASFCRHGHFEALLLTDEDGQLQFSLVGLPREVAPAERSALRQAHQFGVPCLSDLFRPANGNAPRLSAVAWVRTPTATHGLILVADPQTFLYPLLQSWPLPSRSAEALLVQREGDAVLFLNELRHQSNTLLRLRIPLTHTEVPAVQAVLGRQGVVAGVDYRGVPVFSALAAVPAAPWFLVGKEDEAEALAEWRLQSCLIFSLFAVLLLGLVAAGWLIWQQLQQRHYRAAYLAERERQELRQQHAQLIRHANDIIVLSDAGRHIIEANHRAQEAYGYTQAEMLGLPVARLIPASEQGAFEKRMRELETRGEFRSEGLHQRKDGSQFPVEMSACVIAVEGGQITQTITRDITERRAHLAEIERMNRLYVALSQVNQSIVRAHTREELFAEMCRVLIDFGGFKLAWIGLVNPATQQVEIAARHGTDGQLLDGVQVFASDRPEGRGTVGPAIRENRPVVVADFMGASAPWRPFRSTAKGRPAARSWSMPANVIFSTSANSLC